MAFELYFNMFDAFYHDSIFYVIAGRLQHRCFHNFLLTRSLNDDVYESELLDSLILSGDIAIVSTRFYFDVHNTPRIYERFVQLSLTTFSTSPRLQELYTIGLHLHA